MDTQLDDKAKAVMDQLWGDRAERELMPAERLAPEFFALASAACFGGFWSRPGLDIRSRSLCTVAQLAALGRSNELKIHLRGALIEDASYEWKKPRGDVDPVWQFALHFSDEKNRQASLAIDLPSKRLRLIGSDREVGIAPIIKGIEDLIERQSAPEQEKTTP